jgi:DNA helicase-2/ATP-dependent DNA helicase PcrA
MKQNNVQHEAIHHLDGPMMVLAGPGAGKTYVITNRVQCLIEEYHVEPEKILVVTFSKAAAVEMRERFEQMTGGRRYRVRFGTFHSVFFQILQLAYHYTAKDIVTPSLKYRFLEEALLETEFEVEDKKEFIEDIEKEISKVKGEGIDIDSYYSTNCPEAVFRKMYCGYCERLQRHRMLDFDDMVVYTYELLSARSDILARWQAQYRYILIDEFQDINRLQYENIRMLARPQNNLFIVGDDDQSIYGFRGARPDIMLSFPKQFPDAKKVTLGVNYRCSTQILTAADRLIGHNKKRFGKKLTAEGGRREDVHICCCKNLSAESARIIRQIHGYAEKEIPYESMAVLFRTNMQMRTLAGKLMEQGIPFTMKEYLPNMFETWLAKDLLCYIEIAMGNHSREKFLRICNRPVRYLSRAAFDTPEVTFNGLKGYYRRKAQFWMFEKIDDFENELRAIRTMSPYSALHYIRKGIGYDDFLTGYAKERGVNAEDWFELLDEVLETARDMKSIPEWLAFVDGYGEKLEELRRENHQKEKEGVQLMTMHSSKGLEFEVVFIPTVNEGVSPYRKAKKAGELEEERRMLYVAMTRAKRFLHLSYVRERFNKSIEPSRFLAEISPKNLSAPAPSAGSQ